jgi:hypothetical protein
VWCGEVVFAFPFGYKLSHTHVSVTLMVCQFVASIYAKQREEKVQIEFCGQKSRKIQLKIVQNVLL